jgi:hypothetical protein
MQRIKNAFKKTYTNPWSYIRYGIMINKEMNMKNG